MLEIKHIESRKAEYIEALKKRNVDAAADLNKVIALNDERKKTQAAMDEKLSESNNIAKQIGELFKQGKREEAEALKARPAELKEEIAALKNTMHNTEEGIKEILYGIPNIPHALVTAGVSEEDNETVFEEGEIPELGDNAKPHWDLAKDYKLIDFELGVKISGAGFPVYMGKGAQLQRALINFFLEEAREAGYMEVMPPLMVNETSGYGTGQLPDKEGQMYYVTEDDLYLIPTAEVPITNIFRDEIIKSEDFPIQRCGYTPCFRREAGSYGKDVRGLNRLHQFDKVEIVEISDPATSYENLDRMVEHVKGLLRKLELPYRILRLCGGDLGFTSALTYDFEVYSTAQSRWLECSSVSNFETFQANRLKLRYKDANGKTQLVHTLNGSALALPRIVAALLENHQTADGIKIPKALQPFTGFDMIY
ncbi:MAG: serine--tRNA ligase [Flavobacteriales bacterium]|nr:serine--tRNA ligase [Flavobacteriales bacterium]